MLSSVLTTSLEFIPAPPICPPESTSDVPVAVALRWQLSSGVISAPPVPVIPTRSVHFINRQWSPDLLVGVGVLDRLRATERAGQTVSGINTGDCNLAISWLSPVFRRENADLLDLPLDKSLASWRSFDRQAMGRQSCHPS